jgi:hypothetical protein
MEVNHQRTGKELPVPIKQKAGGESESRSERFIKEKILLLMSGIEPHTFCARCEKRVFNLIKGRNGTVNEGWSHIYPVKAVHSQR